MNATVLYDYDYVASNDQFNRSFAVIPPKSSPYVENFDNGTFNPDDYSFKKAYYTYYDLSTDRVWYGDTSSFTTMKIGPINSGEFLVFEYLSQAFDNSSWSRLGTYMRAGDVASVYISSNCGATWQKVKDITSHANTNDPNQFPFESVGKIDLSAYANKTIRVKIEFVKGNPEGSAIFSVDNLQVIGSGDARVSALAMPQYVNGVAVCGAVNDEVVVEIENTGINTLTKVPVMVQRVYGQDTTVVMATYTGSIAPGMTDTITVAGFNTTEFGDYEIIAATMLEGDLNPDNDMYDAWLTVQSLSTVPYTYDGSWKPSVWQYFTDNGNSWNANVDVNNDMYWDSYLATPYMDDDDTAFVTMQKLGPIRADYKLRFSYNVFAFDDDQQFLSNYFRNGDKMEVQVSSNCGASYTTIFTADPSNYVNSAMDTMIVLGLDKFIDKDISVRFVVVKGSEIGKIRVGFNQIDVTIPAADLVLNQIYVDNQVCGKAEEGVYAVVTNASPFETLTGFNVSAVVTVANVVMEEFSSVYAGELLPGVTDTMFLGYFNSEMPNDYLVEASLQFEEDVDNSSNMASVYFTIHAPVQVPYFNNFSYDASNWLFKENSWFDGWSRLRTSSLNPGDTALFYSPKFEAITASSQMEFDFAKSNEFAIGDKLEVFVSDNCGSAWTLVNTVANDDNLSNFSVDRQITSLSAFAGKDIIVKFVFTNKNGSWYQATIDNFAINQSDVAVIGIVNETHKFDINQFNPNNGSTNFAERYITCGSANDSIFVVVENKGATSVSNFAVKLDVTGKAESSFTQTFNGTLEPGAKGWMYVGSVNSGTPGLLDMRASVALANDGNTANDTLGFSVTTQSTYEMPYSAFNSNEFNQNYYWKYDNNGFMNNSGNYLYSTLSRDQVGYAVSPKVRAEASSWLYFNYYVSNTLNEGHIIHDESLQVFVISNCSGNATEVWSMDVTSTDNTRNGTIALDLSAYAGADVQIMFKASKGNSDGGLYSEFTNIQLKEAGPISAVFESGDELFMNTNGAELCEGAGYSLNLLEFPVATMTYEWTFIGADTTYVVSDNYSYNDNIENYNNGTFTLTAWYTTNPSNKYTQSVDVAVRSLPTLPVISGDVNVVSNVGTTNYTLTGKHADEYIWTISNGGQISGDKSAVVFWNEGYLGTSVIYAQGRNVCGYGEEGELLVRVDYLNPTPGGNVADTKEGDANGMINNPGLEISTYPNPSDGNFAVTLPDGVSEGTLVIKNNLGYVVSQETVLTNKHDVQLLNLPSGVYYITFVSADKVFTKSIVIK